MDGVTTIIKHKLMAILDREAYFERFNVEDMIARDCRSKRDCLNTYIDNLRHPSKDEMLILNDAIEKANILIAARRCSKLRDLPWIVLVTSDKIESGFPHTHGDTIIIPRSHITRSSLLRLVDTLIHEKIHVFQRIYPCESNVLYTRFWNFNIAACVHASPPHYRTNPDTNFLVYKDVAGREISTQYASSDSPSLGATVGDDRDHPHEIMAYVVTHIITGEKSRLRQKLKEYIEPTKNWLHQSNM